MDRDRRLVRQRTAVPRDRAADVGAVAAEVHRLDLDETSVRTRDLVGLRDRSDEARRTAPAPRRSAYEVGSSLTSGSPSRLSVRYGITPSTHGAVSPTR